MINLENISLDDAQGHEQFCHISLKVKTGDIHYICGANGTGKTPLCELLALHRRPYRGVMHYWGLPITYRTPRRRLAKIRQYIGYISQKDTLLDDRSVIENIALPLQLQKTPYDTLKKELFDLLQWFKLYDKAFLPTHALSAGERRQTQMARAVICRPHVIIADSPFTYMDETHKQRALSIFQQLSQFGTTLIISGEDPHEMQACTPHHISHMHHDGFAEKGASP